MLEHNNQLTRMMILLMFSVVLIIALIGGCISKYNEVTADVAKQAINKGLEECPKAMGCGTIWVKSCKEYSGSAQ